MFKTLFHKAQRTLSRRQRRVQKSLARKPHFTGLEPLEDRVMLSAVLFVDFGDNFPSGTLTTTQGAFRDVADDADNTKDILGSTLLDSADGFNTDTRLDIVAQTFSTTARDRMMAVVERAFESLDIEVVELTSGTTTTSDGRSVSAASSMNDVIDTLRGGDADSKDAYVFVATFIVDPLGDNTQVYGNNGGGTSPGNGLDTSDLNAASNIHDDVAVVFSNGGFSNNTLNNISHEAGHLLGMQHAITNPTNSTTTNLFHQAEIMSYRNTNNTTSSTFTRYPMIRGDGNSPDTGVLGDYNDLAARNGQVTLHDQLRLDANVLANPDFTFVSGTGAHDIITITKNGANADVTVQAFADAAYSSPITVPGEADSTYSYSIPLTETILIHAGGSNDSIIVDGDLGVDIRLDGMLGTDMLTVDGKGAASAVYTPNATAPDSVDLINGNPVDDYGGALSIGGNSILFNNFEFGTSLVTVTDVDLLTLRTPGSDDLLTVDSPGAGINQVSGSSDGIDFVPLHFTDVTGFVLDAATNDGVAGTDTIDVDSALVASGLVNFTVNGGNGVDTLAFTAGAPMPVTYTPDALSPNDPSRGTLTFGGGSMFFTGMEYVTPVAPVIGSTAISSTNINENDTVTLTGGFIDPGSLSSHTVTIDWGDGSTDTVEGLAVGDRSFSINHTYLDDNPTATPVDVNDITVTITDNDNLSDVDNSLSITVSNVNPVITSFASDATFEDKGEEGEPVTITANFTDVGTLDTHAATVDWGDGTTSNATVTQGSGSGTIEADHIYANGGVYVVTLTLTDDDTGTDIETTLAVITGIGINNGTLYIVGSNEDDRVHVEENNQGQVRVHASFVDDPLRTYESSQIDKIISYLCDGDDDLTIANKVDIPAIVHGGAGNDHLHAGSGTTVLLGDEGHDTLVGQFGRNIMIGGAGRDRLVGGKADDVLIGGIATVAVDSEGLMDSALMAAAMAWGDESETYANRSTSIQVMVAVVDDGDEDLLTGSASRDLFYDGLGDMLTDVKSNEDVL